jgi:Protein of unknown function (DUF1566)
MKFRWSCVYAIMFILISTLAISLACSGGNDNDGKEKDDPGFGGEDDDDSNQGAVWTDSDTGLWWQIVPEEKIRDFKDAIDYCEDLILGEFDDWRLPTISELRSVVRDCPNIEAGGKCEVTDNCLSFECTDDSCSECGGEIGPGEEGMYWPNQLDGPCCDYWSSEDADDSGFHAWVIDFFNGLLAPSQKFGSDNRVRCVRSQ